ncbi:MAG TPA: TldD/PmbA family protein, partial [Thermoplasmata archaeon]|nr:TldD/PmbA family protein [Thermoplasmata archaeon]
MSDPTFGSETAFRAADEIRRRGLSGAWDIFGERAERFEVHLNGTTREMLRAPIRLEGIGLRVLRPHDGKLGVGFAATSDRSPESLALAVENAEATARFSRFPAAQAELPAKAPASSSVDSVDRAAWAKPLESLEAYVHDLASAFEGRTDVVASFGSVHLTLAESTLANSAGLEHRAARTLVDLEIAVKAFGGPEGRPPGEYWVTAHSVRLDPSHLKADVDAWCARAKDVRIAKPPHAGEQTVVLPPRVLTDVLPEILSFRLSGTAAIRGITPKAGESIGTERVNIWNDPRFPFGIGSSAVDDEGTPTAKQALVTSGRAEGTLFDLLHGSATAHPSTGSGLRETMSYPSWDFFTLAPNPMATTLVVGGGDVASDAELAEVAGEGIWVDQLGYAFPDPLSAAFGGEIRIGYRIHHGKIAEPLRGGTVGGVVVGGAGERSVLNSVVALGRPTQLTAHLSCPALVVEKMGVGGA